MALQQQDSASQMAVLSRRRDTIRGQITRTVNRINELFNSDSVPTPDVLKTLKIRLDQVTADVQAVDSALDPLFSAEAYQAEMDRVEDYQEKLAQGLARLELLTDKQVSGQLPRDPATLGQQSTQTLSSSSQIGTQSNNGAGLGVSSGLPNPNQTTNLPSASDYNRMTVSSAVRLPKLNPKHFDGTLTEWPTFYDQFLRTIHCNPQLNDCDRFVYLLESLSGSALQSIRTIQVRAENYHIALEKLIQQYGDTELVVQDVLRKMRALKPARNQYDLNGLSSLHDGLTGYISSLKTMKVAESQYEAAVVEVLDRCVPPALRLKFYESWHPLGCSTSSANGSSSASTMSAQDSEKPKYEHFLDFLFRHKRLMVRSNIKCEPEKSENFNTDGKSKKGRMPPAKASAAALVANVKKGGPSTNVKGTSVPPMKRTPHCLFCDQGHWASECSHQMTVEDRMKILRQKGRCFRCFKPFHLTKDCSDQRIKCSDCGGRHYRIICNKQAPPLPLDHGTTTVNLVAHHRRTLDNVQTQVYAQTARVWVMGPKGRLLIRVMLDTGSQRSFIRQDVIQNLNLPVQAIEDLYIARFNQPTPVHTKSRRVLVRLKGQYTRKMLEMELLEIKEICSEIMPELPSHLQETLKQKGYQPADAVGQSYMQSSPEIGILIGSDLYWEVVKDHTLRLSDQLAAVETNFGWCISGATSCEDSRVNVQSLQVQVHTVATRVLSDLSQNLRQFWDLDAIGISADVNSPEKDLVLQDFQSAITFIDGHYQVALPWKDGREELANNFQVAKHRLKRLLPRLKQDKSKLENYKTEILQLRERQFAEIVPEPHKDGEIEYFMPHRGVVRDDKATTKLRIVFDASSSASGRRSLNELLDAGPNLTSSLVGVLLNFRLGSFAIVADITKAFLMISIQPEDRPALRFLWPRHPENYPSQSSVDILQMCRLPFGLTSSPFILAATLDYHLSRMEPKYPLTTQELRSSLYVDDILKATSSFAAAQKFKQESTAIFEEAGMVLHGWKSNDNRLINSTQDQNGKVMNGVLKVLGIGWNSETDEFVFSLVDTSTHFQTLAPTKRTILSDIAKIYDPLGWLSPLTLFTKVIMQQLWMKGLDWDTTVTPNLAADWQKWVQELIHLEHLTVKRNILGDSSEGLTYELHVFGDASKHAYAAVAYLTVQSSLKRSTEILMSKGRITPMQPITLPRLELLGALLAARLCDFLLKTLNIKPQSVILWSDSSIVLHWISDTTKRRKPFVQNRIIEIRKHTKQYQWRHCPGTENPADLATRGVSARVLPTHQLWWHGPTWLQQGLHAWPKGPLLKDLDPLQDPEMVEELPMMTVTIVRTTATEEVFDVNHYSSLNKCLRVTAWVFRFLSSVRKQSHSHSVYLTAKELSHAKMFWIQKVQQQAYPEELHCLKHNQKLNSSSAIQQYCPLYIDGVIKAKGRLVNSTINIKSKQPIILPASHKWTYLLVQDAHKQVHHGGINDTLTQLREEYLVPKGRQLTKRIIKECLSCHRISGPAVTAPTAPLPSFRITESLPFQHSGLDFAGPLLARCDREMKKCYIALFTCASSRAVHLELVSSMSVPALLLALRRFFARRGVSENLYTDNARTFRKANNEIKHLYHLHRHPDIQDFYATKGINWSFIVERAPWWGGFWERLVRTVKGALKRSLGTASLNFEELTTVLCEVEATVNSRPLTFTYMQPEEPEPLTPAHLLVGHRLTSLPPTAPITHGGTKALERRWQYRQTLTRAFWKRWTHEYLVELRFFKQQMTKQPYQLKVGEPVLIADERIPRLQWKLGLVQQLHPGRDGNVRACSVRVVKPRPSVLRRPVQLIYPLEASPTDGLPCRGEDVKILQSPCKI